MSGKVTALGMDVITEKSGHTVAPMAPSVCTTPAAPGPLPVPYPGVGTSKEGIVGAPSRTKINGAKTGTVGSALKACHGMDPGVLKDVVSHNTGGRVGVMMGAPTVWIERGMAGFTGSPTLANLPPGGGGRTAPCPQAGPATALGAAVLGGGNDTCDGNGNGDGGKDGAGGGGAGGGQGGNGDGKHAPGGQDGQCSGGHPVDVVTGRAYTLPAIDLELPGPLPLVFARVYSTSAAERDVGLGFGWACSWSWEIEVRRRDLVVWSDEGIATDFPALDVGAEHIGPWGWVLRRERERFVLDTGDGLRRIFAAVDETANRWKLLQLLDRNDNRIELGYDDGGRLVEVIDSVGRTLRVLSTRAGQIAALQVINARARGRWVTVARYAYDEAGDLAAAFDAGGLATRYAYDDEHRLTRETDRVGLAFCFAYDREGRCVETWGEYPGRRDPSLADDVPAKLADGARARGVHHVRLDYHPDRYTEVADSTQIRRYFGNRHGLVSKRIEGFGVEEAAYDERGFVVARADGEGATTSYERDARGRVVRAIDPLGRTTTYERDRRGLAVRIIDPAGGVYEILRDDRGNVIHEADPTGATTSYTYDARGLVTSITSPAGGVTRLAYDADGNLVEQTEPTGARWRWAYDVLGRRTLEVDPVGNEASFTWTGRGDLAAVRDPAGGVTRYTYDGERRLSEIHGPGQRTIGLAWGGFGRLVEKTNPTGDVVRYRYNREGEIVEVRNELGDLHRLHRNGAGLVVREETFDGRTITYRHDRAGRVVRSGVAGEMTEHAYNAAGELTARTLPDDTAETFEHDARGELMRATWPGGELRLERDAAGRVVHEVQSYGGEIHSVKSAYDPAGASILRTTSRGHVERVERDAGGERLRTILDELHDVDHARDPLGRETERALPRDGRVHHAYDPLGRVERRWATAPGELHPVRAEDPAWVDAPAQPARVTAEHEYSYSPEGERSDAFDRRRGWVQYDYDPAGRLLSVLREATGQQEAFRYDAAGNPYETGRGIEGEARAYGPGGRLLRRGATVYTWDDGGHLVAKRTPREGGGADVWRYAWDAAGRLAAVDLPDGRRSEYAYDPLGRRVEARLYEGPPPAGRARLAERTRFVWDGDTIAHAICTRAAAEGAPVVEERTYCFEDGAFVPWAQCDDVPDGYGGRRRAWAFHVNDPIGTPDELVGADGAVLAELDRRAWGRTQAAERARAETPLRFQGQHEDPETGLFHNGFRYYDPDAALYLSPDPLGLAGGLRPFGYVLNPTGWIDPLGLAPTPLNKGGFIVYGHFEPGATEPRYVGITDNFNRRKGGHIKKGRVCPGVTMKILKGEKDLTYAQARGREQAYMEHYGTKNGFPGNVYNSVNTNRTDARGRAFNSEYRKTLNRLDGA
jgi:RHS repeat-associated protein